MTNDKHENKQPSPAGYCLTIRVPGQSVRQVLLDKPAHHIGRGQDNDIVLPLEYVSRKHGLLEQRGGLWIYTDLESSNGTFVNGRQARQVTLGDGDVIRIGDEMGNSASLTFERRQPEAVKPSISGLTQVSVERLSPDRALMLGRGTDTGLHLPSPQVSRHHALVQPTRSGGWAITDQNSVNGTFVNGQRIERTTLLKPGDMIQVGPFRLVYSADSLAVFAASRGIRLDGLHISWSVGRGKRAKRILYDVNISCHPKEFVSLVGGSGAGKTTLMKILSGLLPAEGRVLIEGEDLYQNFEAYRSLMGYVPQDDILHKELSVEQALRYAARFRLPPDTTPQEIEQRITRVLEQVELTGQRSQVINSLSGGQRKRASIAVELLADPPLLFLDEPTSGLDPGLEKKMMHTLRKLADEGKTVILVTHATANITQCDHVAFMSQGRVVYFGPPEEASDFFGVGKNDFADIYTEINDPDPGEAKKKAASWEERFRASPFFRKYVIERIKAPAEERPPAEKRLSSVKKRRLSSFGQFLLLTRRYFDLVIRDRILSIILVGVLPLVALLFLIIAEPHWLVGDPLEVIDQQLSEAIASGEQSDTYVVVMNGQGLLFLMSLTAVFLGFFSAAYEVVKERTVYYRERMVFLRLVPYIASKVVLLSAFASVQILIFMWIIKTKVTFPEQGIMMPAFAEMYITLMLGVFAAIMLGLFVSTIAPTPNSITYILLALVVIQILFGGVIFPLPGAAGKISAATLSRWATEGMGISADVDYLNSLTRSRFKPEAREQEVTVEVEKPDPDWTPVTITSETIHIRGCSVPITMPVVVENEMETVMEEVTETVTVDPDASDVLVPRDLTIDYTRTREHLFRVWGTTLGLAFIFGAITLIALRKQDII
ncbi:MAG: FHA domain-containing protein [Chloroflexota bacterium]